VRRLVLEGNQDRGADGASAHAPSATPAAAASAPAHPGSAHGVPNEEVVVQVFVLMVVCVLMIVHAWHQSVSFGLSIALG
jgi:hypothetical protein